MSDKKQKNTGEVNWSEYQKKYFDALMAFNTSNSFVNNSSSENSFWRDAMENWWKSIKSNPTIENGPLFEKVIEQCRNYYFMGEQFSSLIEGIKNLNNNDSSSFINKKFKEFESLFTQTPNDFSWSSFLDSCEQPYEFMKNSASNNDFDFFNMFEDINPEMKKMRDQFLSMPAIGYDREKQEKLQKLIKLGAIYQDNNNEHQSVLARLTKDALELMREKIISMSKKGEEINSMRQIFDLWVESNEKVYIDYAYTDEYAELNGRLVNSQMAVKKLSQEMTEDVLSAMNMPTTRAMNELEHRHYELRKKLKIMESELKSLKETINNQSASKDKSVVETKPELVIKKTTKKKSAGSISKGAEKKVSKKKATKKKVIKKKVVTKATKSVKKKAKRKTANKDVIEIKF